MRRDNSLDGGKVTRVVKCKPEMKKEDDRNTRAQGGEQHDLIGQGQ